MSKMNDNIVNCPVCNRKINSDLINEHVNKCLFLNDQSQHNLTKRKSSHLEEMISFHEKKIKLGKQSNQIPTDKHVNENLNVHKVNEKSNVDPIIKSGKPLAECLRPINLDDLVGQTDTFGPGSLLRNMMDQKKVPNMILWGPPGCGKTSMANIIASMCKQESKYYYFAKLTATIAGINEVKEIVKVAKNEAQFKRQTVLFMDEIHRFNKLQQDTFLPHVENGTIILVGATTENPSFSLNNALLSRCRVVVFKKLTVDDVLIILNRALNKYEHVKIKTCSSDYDKSTRVVIDDACLLWLAEMCDGDARMALGALELTLNACDPGQQCSINRPTILTLEDVKKGIQKTHIAYDRGGEEHYNIISAIHKSIRASDDNAALYWTSRALAGGEDPLYVARRLVRIASEDIGLAEPNALVEAVACLHGCQQIGMPECDVLLSQCAVRLARMPKSTEVYSAMKRCQAIIRDGDVPPVPLHLRNASSKLMKQLGYGDGYNTLQKEDSGLTYLPKQIKDVNFFCDDKK